MVEKLTFILQGTKLLTIWYLADWLTVVRYGFHSDNFRSQMCNFHLWFFPLFVQMQCSKFKWWYLWCCFAVFVFLLPRDWPVYCPVEWYLVFLMIWCLVCLSCVPFTRYFLYGYIRLFALQLGSVDSFINRLVDWSIDPSMFDWLVDRPIDRLTHSLICRLLAERL